MRISDWSSDVCSSDLQWLIRPRKNVQRRVINLDPIEWIGRFHMPRHRLVVVFRFLRSFTTPHGIAPHERVDAALARHHSRRALADRTTAISNPLMQGSGRRRSEEQTSELQSLMRHSYAVFLVK